jgi:thymidylate kinase
MDLGLSLDIQESFRLFEGRMLKQYTQMHDEFHFLVIDATRDIHEQQEAIRQEVRARIALDDFREGEAHESESLLS